MGFVRGFVHKKQQELISEMEWIVTAQMMLGEKTVCRKLTKLQESAGKFRRNCRNVKNIATIFEGNFFFFG